MNGYSLSHVQQNNSSKLPMTTTRATGDDHPKDDLCTRCRLTWIYHRCDELFMLHACRNKNLSTEKVSKKCEEAVEASTNGLGLDQIQDPLVQHISVIGFT